MALFIVVIFLAVSFEPPFFHNAAFWLEIVIVFFDFSGTEYTPSILRMMIIFLSL